MKNLSIRNKLLTGFLILAAIALIVGAVGIRNLLMLSENIQQINTVNDHAMSAQEMRSVILDQRSTCRGAALKDIYEMRDLALADLERMEECEEEFWHALAEVQVWALTEQERDLVNRIEQSYGELAVILERCSSLIRAKAPREQILDVLLEMIEPMEHTLATIDDLVAYTGGVNAQTELATQSYARQMAVVLAVIVLLAIVLAVWMGIYIARLISAPIRQLVSASRQLAAGDVEVKLQISSRDETGELARAFQEMAACIRVQSDFVAKITSGDYTDLVDVRSEMDVMNQTINLLVRQSNKVLGAVRDSAVQVEQSAGMLSQASRMLADDSNLQAGMLQEFGESVSNMREMSHRNAEMAASALEGAQTTKGLAEKGLQAMDDTLHAMQEISRASDDIANVIRVIEDISFQTNILALNASIEAARAGVHGKGFSVVAGEVQNLAQKSAAAVAKTVDLIDRSSSAVTEGNRIVYSADASIRAMGEIAVENGQAMEQMCAVSAEQNMSMQEVSKNLNEIMEIVHKNSGIAQETAAESQELSAQAMALSKMIGRFQLKQPPRNKRRTPRATATGVCFSDDADYREDSFHTEPASALRASS